MLDGLGAKDFTDFKVMTLYCMLQTRKLIVQNFQNYMEKSNQSNNMRCRFVHMQFVKIVKSTPSCWIVWTSLAQSQVKHRVLSSILHHCATHKVRTHTTHNK